MAVEKGLDKIKGSAVTWLVGIVGALALTLGMNAKGMFDDVQETKASSKEFQSSQNLLNQRLIDAIDAQHVTNQKLSDRIDTQDRLIDHYIQQHPGK